mgnify:CR=1 FL=1
MTVTYVSSQFESQTYFSVSVILQGSERNEIYDYHDHPAEF